VEKTLKIIFYCFLRPENNKIILVMPITLRLAPDGLEACGAANLSSALDWAWDGGVWIEAQVWRIIVLVLGWAEPVQGRDTGETDIRTQLRRRTGSMLVTEIVEGPAKNWKEERLVVARDGQVTSAEGSAPTSRHQISTLRSSQSVHPISM
jgi:hypothetical protein